jgi:hypothetical protein
MWGRLVTCGRLLIGLPAVVNNRRLEFVLFSGSSGSHKLTGRRLNAKMLDQFRMLGDLFSEQRNQIEARGAFGMAAPLGQLGVGVTSTGAKDLERGEHQSAVSGNNQGWLFGNSDGVPQLRLAHAQGIFLLAMVHLSGKGLARC